MKYILIKAGEGSSGDGGAPNHD